MRSKEYLLAHDLGTTGNKSTLFDIDGKMIATAYSPYTTTHSMPGRAEQNPQDWWRAVCVCTRELLGRSSDIAERIVGVSSSGMMNGCVLIDDNGEAVRPAMIHADIRSTTQCARIARDIGQERACAISGNRLAPYFTLGKLAWLAEQESESLKKARWCVQAKDYLAGRLTGVWGITDPSDASLTGMFDLSKMAWSDELVTASGAPKSLFPTVVPSITVVGRISPQVWEETGLLPGTPVALGGGDGACATAGAGALFPGDAYHYLGGTSWIGVITDGYQPDPEARISTLCGLAPGEYVNYGTVQSAGSSIEWFLRTVEMGDDDPDRYDRMEALALQSAPGSRGLIYLPYLQGERSPIWNPNARGAFIGLTEAHGKADLARSVYEGVAFALGSIMKIYDEMGLASGAIRALGGGMRSRLWRHILAAVYQHPLLVMERLVEATSCGAAIAAGMAVGLLPDRASARRFSPVMIKEDYDPELGKIYSEKQVLFERLYPLLKPVYDSMQEKDEFSSM